MEDLRETIIILLQMAQKEEAKITRDNLIEKSIEGLRLLWAV